MKAERRCYERPKTNVIKVDLTQMIATSGNVSVGGWGDGGSIGGGEAEEGTDARRGEWGILWYNEWSNN